jgi:hypothetical protein
LPLSFATDHWRLVDHNKSMVCRPVDHEGHRLWLWLLVILEAFTGLSDSFVCHSASLLTTGDLLITTSLWSVDPLITTGHRLWLWLLVILEAFTGLSDSFVCHSASLLTTGDLLITTSLVCRPVDYDGSSTMTLASGYLGGVHWSLRQHLVLFAIQLR